jgi:hypothetical protein
MHGREQADAILRYHRHLARHGFVGPVDLVARLWIARYALLRRLHRDRRPD